VQTFGIGYAANKPGHARLATFFGRSPAALDGSSRLQLKLGGVP
jgi:hypothetical protein